MSIRRADDCEFEITCTGCDVVENIDSDGDWSRMLRELRDLGWKVEKDADEEWCHWCPECKQSIDFR